MKQAINAASIRAAHFLRTLLKIVGAILLPACTQTTNADLANLATMHDLEYWQSSARKSVAASHHALAASSVLKAPKTLQAPKQDIPLESNPKPNPRIAAMRNPFSPFVQLVPLFAESLLASTQSPSMRMRNTAYIGEEAAIEEPALLHLLGTIHDGDMIYALIEAGKQVHCVALKATVPSYPVTIAGITEHAVQLDRLLADGSHRRSTLRQGE